MFVLLVRDSRQWNSCQENDNGFVHQVDQKKIDKEVSRLDFKEQGCHKPAVYSLKEQFYKLESARLGLKEPESRLTRDCERATGLSRLPLQ